MITIATLALAADPPARPSPPAPTPNECARSIPVVAGAPVPPELAGKATCGGVLLPSSDLADLLAVEVAYDELRGRYVLDTGALEAQLAVSRGETAWWRSQAERPVPLFQRPGVALGVGLAGGALSVLLGGLAVRFVGETPLFPESP